VTTIEVVAGQPDAEELAALVAVLAALPTPTTPAVAQQPEWSAPARLVRRPLLTRGWAASARAL
jgi:hypothetical protein